MKGANDPIISDKQTLSLPQTILAKESVDFSARIAVLGLECRFKSVFRNPRTKKHHFFCEE
jgi:hypothetical protein